MIPSSGPINMSDVSVETGRIWNYATSLNESVVRNLTMKSSGQISMSDLRGAYGYFNATPDRYSTSGQAIAAPFAYTTAYCTPVAISRSGGTPTSAGLYGFLTISAASIAGTPAQYSINQFASITFWRTMQNPGSGATNTYSGVMRCTCWDAGSNRYATFDVTVTTYHTSTTTGGGGK